VIQRLRENVALCANKIFWRLHAPIIRRVSVQPLPLNHVLLSQAQSPRSPQSQELRWYHRTSNDDDQKAARSSRGNKSNQGLPSTFCQKAAIYA
jgi:hypothetical protein